jgi:plasmid maintenance system antidote protein VapI
MLILGSTFVKTIQKAVDLSARIMQICTHYDVSLNRFATKTGVHYNTLRNIVDGKTKSISGETVDRICKAYPVDQKWLQYGEGSMFTAGIDYVKLLAEKDREILLLQQQVDLFHKLEKMRDENESLKKK